MRNRNTKQLESQLIAMKKKLLATPEKINEVYNNKYFALKNSIAKKERAIQQAKVIDWLAQ